MKYLWFVLAVASFLVGSWAAWRATRGRDAVIAAAWGAGMVLALELQDVARGLPFNWPRVVLDGMAVALALGSLARARPSQWHPGWIWPAGEGVLGAAALVASAFGGSALGAMLLGAGGLLLAAELIVSTRVRR